MTTWTPATSQAETWTSEDASRRVFSRDVYSHASYTSKTIFAVGSFAGIWGVGVKQAETWTVEAAP